MPGVGDVEFVTLQEEITIEFTTDNTTYSDGIILEDFEELSNWLDPLLSENTTGIDSEATSFDLVSNRKVSGSNAGNLKYGFAKANGAVELASTVPLEINRSENSVFGLWIFGDNSGNKIKYRFEDSISYIFDYEICEIDWTGWKMKSIDVSNLEGNGNLLFKSLLIYQNSKIVGDGNLYFDAAQVDYTTPVAAIEEKPFQFSLDQNYPNPFNPSTVIEYTVPSKQNNGLVTLKIFDILGRELVTLVNQVQPSGKYKVEFDASKFASGVYYYQLRTEAYKETRKMMLLK